MKQVTIITFCLFFLATSCQDMLIEKPVDRLFSDSYYKTASDAEAAVNAIYNPLRTAYGDRYGVQFTGVEDYASGQGVYIPVSAYQGYPSSIISLTDEQWNRFYQAINLANIVLKYVPEIPMDEIEKTALLAEAKFLRAVSYFALVRSWGGVPIRTEPTESFDGLDAPRASAAEVYDVVVEDLKEAAEGLPEVQGVDGKPTKWSAKTMLADVYLTIGDFENASQMADEVITSGVYTLVSVQQPDDFESIFGPESTTSTEDVFSLKFSRSRGSNVPLYYAMPNSAYASRGYGTFFGFPYYPLLRDWDRDDLRYQFNIYTSYPDKNGQIVETSDSQPIRFAKFKDTGYAPSHGNDYPLYRYPDALLIYAEAACRVNGGPTALAVERLNMVKRRAYGYNPNESSPVDFELEGQTGEGFIKLVLTERAYEFLCEGGKRWFDLIRTGTVKEVIKEAKGIDVADKHLYFPIPRQEMENNDELGPEDQNDGY